jgi:hypothetical protein
MLVLVCCYPDQGALLGALFAAGDGGCLGLSLWQCSQEPLGAHPAMQSDVGIVTVRSRSKARKRNTEVVPYVS